MSTTIQISDNVKSVLDKMKMMDRETYNEIIERMIEDDLELNEKTKREIEESRKGKRKTESRLRRKLFRKRWFPDFFRSRRKNKTENLPASGGRRAKPPENY